MAPYTRHATLGPYVNCQPLWGSVPNVVDTLPDLRGQVSGLFVDAAETLFTLKTPVVELLRTACSAAAQERETSALARAMRDLGRAGAWPDDQPDQAGRVRAWVEFLTRIARAVAVELDGRTVREIATFVTRPASYKLFPEVETCLRDLHQSYHISVVSNFDSLLEDILKHLGCFDYVDNVVSSGRSGFYKPDPRIFERALDEADTPAARALMIGDSPVADVRGATAVGMQAVLVDRAGLYAEHAGLRVSSFAPLNLALLGRPVS